MTSKASEPRLIIPALEPFYEKVMPLSWLIVRIAAGSILFVHGWMKVPRGPASFAGAYEALGFFPGVTWAWCSTIVETSAGICIILGLFTRFFAAAAAIEMAIITIVYLKNGFSWLGRGYEFTLMWGLICFAIALRGGGPYSLDRKLGIQL
jgi:putative oxidoreductase